MRLPAVALSLGLGLLGAPAAQAQAKPFAAWLAKPQPAWIELSQAPEQAGGQWLLKDVEGRLLHSQAAPALPAGYTLNLGQCKRAGQVRDDWIAQVRHRTGQEWSADLKALWQADAEGRRFVPVPVDGVNCRNEAFGL